MTLARLRGICVMKYKFKDDTRVEIDNRFLVIVNGNIRYYFPKNEPIEIKHLEERLLGYCLEEVPEDESVAQEGQPIPFHEALAHMQAGGLCLSRGVLIRLTGGKLEYGQADVWLKLEYPLGKQYTISHLLKMEWRKAPDKPDPVKISFGEAIVSMEAGNECIAGKTRYKIRDGKLLAYIEKVSGDAWVHSDMTLNSLAMREWFESA